MALRDQPYLPLYVQDFLTDEKLIECSASATGVYIRLMCIMHKSEEYGVILLKQKDKQNDSNCLNFAYKLAKFLPYPEKEILSGLTELLNEGVLILDGDKLIQKRMVKDNSISIVRAEAGSKGGKKTHFAKAKPKAKGQAKPKANTEYEIVYENEDVFNVFLEWLEYKKERKESYKSKKSLQISYDHLVKLSDNNATKAKAIIEQSISNNYAGIFELKNLKDGTHQKFTSTSERTQQAARGAVESVIRRLDGFE